MAKAPTRATIRTYHVGFGDCFLISFQYARKSERHVLIDFGSTGFPKGVPKSRMMEIAEDIKQRTGGKLHAVVATHRHRDHISGFATAKARNGTGDIIKSLKPDLVVQPWTEDPKLAPNATGPSGSSAMTKKFGAGTSEQVTALSLMHEVASHSLAARNLPKESSREIGPRREQHRQPERGQEPHDNGKKFLRLLREQIRVGEGPSGGESRGAWAANTQAD